MELNTPQLITVITAISGLMVIFGKHIVPVIMAWFGVMDKENKKIEFMMSKLELLETNHLVHFQSDLNEVKNKLDKIDEKVDKMDNRLSIVETKIKNR